MGLNPELFRHMTPSQIALALTLDDARQRRQDAAKAGWACVNCSDTGMFRGSFCVCQQGRRLGLQSALPHPKEGEADGR